MSPRLRRLSGRDVVAILGQFGFAVLSQRGSHVKLRRTGTGGEKQTLTIPLHDELDAGTLTAIMRQASRYVSEEQLKPHFYA
jgi:predicted RNA binding protein YcfA (HicA-like mRNA interferase family)